MDCNQFTPPSNAPPEIRRAFSALGTLNDGSTMTLSSNALSAPEGGDVTFTVSASPVPQVDTPVIVSVTEEMGEGADRVARQQFLTLVIKAFESSASQTIIVYSDDDALSDGTLVAQIVAGEGYTLGDPSGVTLPLLDDDGSATPVVSVTGGSDVTEGGDATFTVTASPAPASNLNVSVTVSQSGDFGPATGQRTVTIPTTGSATLRVATTDDQTDEADGSVTATVNAGSDYTVSSTQGAATVSVADNDDASSTGYTVDPAVVAKVRELASQTQHGTAHVNRWNRVLLAFGEHDGTGVTGGPMTASEAQQMADRHSSPVWDEVVTELTALEAASTQTPPPPTPEVSVTAGGGVTEGGDATFTVTASPAPSSNLDVSVTVSQSGDYGATTGQRTVTIPASGSVTLTVGTTDDNADESDGSVTATVSVADDDDAPVVVPVVSITAGGGVTEGGAASFTLSASPAPASALDVTVTVTANGDFGVTTGQRTVTIPTSGSVTFTVGTADDQADEPDGSITVTLNTGSGYSGSGSATVAVSDNDDPPPPVENTDPPVDGALPDVASLTACEGDPELLISSPTASRSDPSVDFTVMLSCLPGRTPTILLVPVRDGELGQHLFVELTGEEPSTTATLTIGSERELSLALGWSSGLANRDAQGDVVFTD